MGDYVVWLHWSVGPVLVLASGGGRVLLAVVEWLLTLGTGAVWKLDPLGLLLLWDWLSSLLLGLLIEEELGGTVDELEERDGLWNLSVSKDLNLHILIEELGSAINELNERGGGWTLSVAEDLDLNILVEELRGSVDELDKGDVWGLNSHWSDSANKGSNSVSGFHICL